MASKELKRPSKPVAAVANVVFRVSGRYATVWPSLHATLGVFLDEKRQVWLYAQKMLRDRDPQIRMCGADLLQILGEDAPEESEGMGTVGTWTP